MSYKNYNPSYSRYKKYNSSSKNFRVKSPIKTFRDLEVYQKTIQLSEELTNLSFLNEKQFEKDCQEIKLIAERIPKLIAEAYGDRFDSKELAFKKITEAVTLAADVITKIDIFRERLAEDKEVKYQLDKLLTRYQTQKRKILNLRRAWERVFNKRSETKPKYRKS